MTAEVNFDGLVGPTHNYAGLSMGNRASMGNAGAVSNPRQAALQGLDKMRSLAALGIPQAVLPPQRRPDPAILAALGFEPGTTAADVARIAPELLATIMSASAMWAANAATVSPSLDTSDGRIHLTPANLSSTTHRSFEPFQARRILRAIFANPEHFRVHDPLPGAAAFADEGAANHGRLTTAHDQPATHVFVYGRDAEDPPSSAEFPRRQTRLAGELISQSHGHDPAKTVFIRQSSTAIDAGAFHNDVVSVVNQRVLFTHEHAFEKPARAYRELDAIVVEVPDSEVPLEDAISSYLFNSQLVTLPDDTMALIAPAEVAETPTTADYLDAAVADATNPIAAVHSFDLRESMRNGGGPACLRLRVVMTAEERNALAGRVMIDEDLVAELEAWVNTHYRDELSPADLADPQLEDETNLALDDLTQILQLDGLYDL